MGLFPSCRVIVLLWRSLVMSPLVKTTLPSVKPVDKENRSKPSQRPSVEYFLASYQWPWSLDSRVHQDKTLLWVCCQELQKISLCREESRCLFCQGSRPLPVNGGGVQWSTKITSITILWSYRLEDLPEDLFHAHLAPLKPGCCVASTGRGALPAACRLEMESTAGNGSKARPFHPYVRSR